MQISGQKLIFPPNFKFFQRLPARFEILVIARGAEKRGTPVFEIEIAGQRLALPSRVPLIPGKRYELEKISENEFRIVREKIAAEKDLEQTHRIRKLDADQAQSFAEFFSGETRITLSDLAVLRLLEDAGKGLYKLKDKFVFDFSDEFELRGLFHPHADGTYTLFVSGTQADENLSKALEPELRSLGITGIRILNAAVFERLSAGAIDLKL